MLKKQGWKGVAAGMLLMLTGLIGGILGFVGYESEMSLSINEAIVVFFNGLGVLGIRVALPK